jgi:hypothetical protein
MQDITASQERTYGANLLLQWDLCELWRQNVALRNVRSAVYFLLGGQTMLRLVTVVIFLMAGAAMASTSPPGVPFSSMSWRALSVKKPTTMLKMGAFSVGYEETTLAQVRDEAGLGRVLHQGDAAESTYWLCYTARGARIWIMSGEMGGGERVIEVAVEDGGFAPIADCPALPVALQPVSFDRGLWVGMSEIKVLEILGPPSHREKGWLSFNFSGKQPGACKPEDADVSNWAFIKVSQGRAVQIHAGQVTSC